MTLRSCPTSALTASWITRSVFFEADGGLLAILRLDGAQLANAFVDLQQFGAECLEAAEAIHLALGLAHLGWIGERVLDRLAVDLA